MHLLGRQIRQAVADIDRLGRTEAAGVADAEAVDMASFHGCARRMAAGILRVVLPGYGRLDRESALVGVRNHSVAGDMDFRHSSDLDHRTAEAARENETGIPGCSLGFDLGYNPDYNHIEVAAAELGGNHHRRSAGCNSRHRT